MLWKQLSTTFTKFKTPFQFQPAISAKVFTLVFLVNCISVVKGNLPMEPATNMQSSIEGNLPVEPAANMQSSIEEAAANLRSSIEAAHAASMQSASQAAAAANNQASSFSHSSGGSSSSSSSSSFSGNSGGGGHFSQSARSSEDEDGWFLYLQISGYKAHELTIHLMGRDLMVTGKHKQGEQVVNQFQQGFSVPSTILMNTIESMWDPAEGELLISGSKTHAKKAELPRQIEIKVKSEL